MSEIKNGGLDQYGAEPFEQQQFGTAGIEGVNCEIVLHVSVGCLLQLDSDIIIIWLNSYNNKKYILWNVMSVP